METVPESAPITISRGLPVGLRAASTNLTRNKEMSPFDVGTGRFRLTWCLAWYWHRQIQTTRVPGLVLAQAGSDSHGAWPGIGTGRFRLPGYLAWYWHRQVQTTRVPGLCVTYGCTRSFYISIYITQYTSPRSGYQL